MRLRPTVVLSVWLLAGCRIGTTATKFEPAVMPGGIRAFVTLEGRRDELQGELLSVSDSALILGTSSDLVLIRYGSIRYARFHQRGFVLTNAVPPVQMREELRMVSRFPQGMSDEVTAALLSFLGRPRLVVLP